MTKRFSLALICSLLLSITYAQCGYNGSLVSLGTGCPGHDTLVLTSTLGASQIIWQNNGAGVAGNSLDMTGYGVYVAGYGQGDALDMLSSPFATFVDRHGYVYVSDYNNNRVMKFAPGNATGYGEVVAGGNGAGAAANQLHGPAGIWVDTGGTLFVCDMLNNRVQKFPAGSTQATNGVTAAGGNGVGTSNNQLYYPHGIFMLPSGYMRVADYGNNRILQFPPGSTQASYASNVAQAGLTNPNAVWADPTGATYVTQWQNSSVLLFPAGSYSATPGTIFAQNGLGQPMGVFGDTSGNIFVADGGTNQGMYKFPLTSNGSTIGIGVGTGAGGNLNGVFLDDTGNIYATDLGFNHVLKFPVGSTPTTHGTIVAGGNYRGTAPNQFYSPVALTFDASGNLYVSDQNNARIKKYAKGSVAGFNGVTVAGGVAGSLPNQLDAPGDICFDAAGNLYVADAYNSRILKFAPGSDSTTNGVVVAGGNGSGSNSNQLTMPSGVFVDATGTLFVADLENNRVLKFPAGSTSATPGTIVAGTGVPGNAANQLWYPHNIFVDRAGSLYVSDNNNHRVQKFPAGSTNGTNAVTIAGGNGSGSGANQLNGPQGLFVDNSGNVFIADYGNNRVQMFPAGSTSTTFGTTVAGGNGVGTSAKQLNGPGGVFVDSAGHIFIADATNHRIIRWSRDTTTVLDSVFIPTTGGTYSALVFYPGCFQSTDSVVISSSAPPTIAITALHNPVCGGIDTILATIVNGGNTPVYMWYKNGVFQPAATGPTLGLSGLATGDSVWCVLISNAPCLLHDTAISNKVTINVLATDTPVVQITATPNPFCSGTAVSLTASAHNAGGNPVYQWYYNGAAVGTDTNSYYAASPANNDSVWCVVTSNSTCTTQLTDTSNKITLLASFVAPGVTVSASQTTFCTGTPVTFTAASVNGGTTPAYAWYVNGNPVGIDTDNYSTNTLADADSVWCVLTSSLSCALPDTAVSNKIVVTISSLVVPTVAIGASPSPACANAPITFTATATNQGAQPRYEWYTNGFTTGPDSAIYVATGLNNGDSVWLKMVSSATCLSYDSTYSNLISVAVATTPFQPLCIVTTDTTLMQNVVIWEKVDRNATDSFYIYRANTPDNLYYEVGRLVHDSLSAFTDPTSVPDSFSYRYKMNLKDTCGNFSALSPYHQTIFLYYQGSGNFSWTPYEIEGGTSPANTYDLYRDTLGNGNWQLITSVQGSQTSASDTNFAQYPNARYKVVVGLSTACNPSRAVTYITSNVLSDFRTGINETGNFEKPRILFNPVYNTAVITNISTPAKLQLTDELGKLIQSINNITDPKLTLDLSNKAAGVYYAIISTNHGLSTVKVVKY